MGVSFVRLLAGSSSFDVIQALRMTYTLQIRCIELFQEESHNWYFCSQSVNYLHCL